jgi:UPF0755 protein
MMKKTYLAGSLPGGSRWKPLLIILGVLAGLTICAAAASLAWYQLSIRPVDAGSQTTKLVTIESGMGADAIADLLEDQAIIRSSTGFSIYASVKGVKTKLRAGTYQLGPNLSVAEIVDKLVRGDIAKRTVTFVPGRRLDQLELVLLEAGYDQPAVTAALKGSGRKILDGILPKGATLEGYLFAETYILPLEAGPEVVIEQAVKQFMKQLTDEVKQGIESQGLTVHEAVILASIVQQESKDPQDQRQIAQVFLKRLREGISLGADPTFKYAAAIMGVPASTTIDSPYNTRIYKGLPPGPIGNFSKTALEAVANPAEGDYLFFVAGKDNVTRFSRTLAEHEALKRQYGVAGQ